MSRLEAQNLDTIQAMQIRMNLQQLFTMDAKTARRFLDRWNAWVRVCDLGPMKRLATTIMAKAPRAFSDRSQPAFPTASWKPSTAMSRPPSARPKATEPSEISKPSSTSSPATCSLIHPLEIARSQSDFDHSCRAAALLRPPLSPAHRQARRSRNLSRPGWILALGAGDGNGHPDSGDSPRPDSDGRRDFGRQR